MFGTGVLTKQNVKKFQTPKFYEPLIWLPAQ